MSTTETNVVVFTPRSTVEVKVGWKEIFPENKTAPFKFTMRIQLVKDAEELQKAWFAMPDEDQTREVSHEHDVDMIALLSVKEPEGFPDFPDNPGPEQLSLDARIKAYFIPADPERLATMQFICRHVMGVYWRSVTPTDYL